MTGVDHKPHDAELTRLHVNIPKSVKDRMEIIASANGETVSTLVRLALREYIEREEGGHNG